MLSRLYDCKELLDVRREPEVMREGCDDPESVGDGKIGSLRKNEIPHRIHLWLLSG